MGKISNFFKVKLSFEGQEKAKSKVVAVPQRFFNHIGNFFLSPVRHLLKGHSATCIVEEVGDETTKKIAKIDLSRPEGLTRVIKTAASVAFVVPGIILGSIFKGGAWAVSSELREQYSALEGELWAEQGLETVLLELI